MPKNKDLLVLFVSEINIYLTPNHEIWHKLLDFNEKIVKLEFEEKMLDKLERKII